MNERPSDGRTGGDVTVGGPVAIVGMACRLPGAASPGEFWNLLRAAKPLPESEAETYKALLGIEAPEKM